MPVDPGSLPVDPLVPELLAHCDFPPAGTTVTCALSGGPDSSALTALAVAAGLNVTAVHVDHGLRAHSSDDADAAQSIAGDLGISCRVVRVDLPDGPNLEARARSARRAATGTEALTGHTADDQAETVLLALFRGSGATGLAGIRHGPTKPIIRLRRTDTHRLCQRLDLSVVHDESNDDPRFRRNRIRHELLPLVENIFDRDVAMLIERAADLLRDDDVLLDELANAIDPTDALMIASAPIPLARRALRRWLTDGGYPPSAAAIERVLAVARGEAVACEVAGGQRVHRSLQRLLLSP
ncbi:MAG: tRNA lysidine(34) synthetase TilS [Actinomycetota bacterium]|mgnify:FL=1|jgi:tRNA(Ile)-lysidine synthase|uniref:tRNA lysidine(34) synthetase TilS n=1 Tax=uncultured Ilumatobacter sp. TaxID=879968 RepID=UPI00374F7C07|nr:tRNA lysidine(34) synthetase TilS [Actinomycetota bacterium]